MTDAVRLEPFRDVLARQEPKIIGEPFEMTAFSNDHPKSCGDPWKGAYSKHGFWYKVGKGNEEDFQKLVALSFEQDGYLLCYEDFAELQKNGPCLLLIAKNLRGEVLGGVLTVLRPSFAQIGCYFVQEDFRHSGIGSTLFRLSLESFPQKDFVFQAMHHLHPSIERFGFRLQLGREFLHFVLDCPTGFPDLKDHNGIKNLADLQRKELDSVRRFLSDVTGMSTTKIGAIGEGKTVAAFHQNTCLGYGIRREVAGGDVRRILIGPLYANEARTTEGILKELLKEFYNPEEDYDFDPDPLAIYRRQVHFFVPNENDFMIKLMGKLAGEKEKMKKQRLFYQTTATGLLPGAFLPRVFATDNLHFSVI